MNKQAQIRYLAVLAGTVFLIAMESFAQTRQYPNYGNRYSRGGNRPVQTPPQSGSGKGTLKEYSPQNEYMIKQCQHAIMRDEPELLRKALGEKPDFNLRDSVGETLFQFAVRQRKFRCIRYLLANKAEVNCTDDAGLSPIFYCSSDYDAKLAEILINAGARTSIQEKNKRWNVFHKAAGENMRIATLSILVREKSGLNVQDKEGRTPLHLAVMQQSPSLEVIRLLLENGANPRIRDNKGKTPLDYAKGKEIRSLLIRFSAEQGTLHNGGNYKRRRR